MKFQNVVLGMLILSALSGCDTNSSNTNPLEGGVVATFKVVNEQYKIWITNEATIQQILDLRDGKIIANIPNGILRRGPGKENHNLPWNSYEKMSSQLEQELSDHGNQRKLVTAVKRKRKDIIENPMEGSLRIALSSMFESGSSMLL